MSVKVAEIKNILQPHSLASEVAYMWDNLTTQRRTWIAEKEELRNYIFATDTTKTTNAQLPWKNKTTIQRFVKSGTTCTPTTPLLCSPMTTGLSGKATPETQ